ncbi:MAG: tetratricopeptide repeat protein [Phycisphaerales bacterium]|nr:tetratricopeptide repeat protein [Phycisphaerales bacterium]MCB9864882.1 tetratricopeptide repeat protein [Phycisphaerales bacterium]
MSDLPQPTPPPDPQKAATVFWLRTMGTVVLILVVLTGAIQMMGRTALANNETLRVIAQFADYLTFVIVGIVCSGLLVGLSALLRVLRDLHASFSRIERYQYEQTEAYYASKDPTKLVGAATPSVSEPVDGVSAQEQVPWRELLGVLEDIRDTSLLTSDQRMEKRQRVAEAEFEAVTGKIRDRTAQGEFATARELAEQIARKYPDDARSKSLLSQVEMTREQHESEDVASCKQQISDLISISAWGRAREMAEQLRQRHPDSAEARQLLLRIERDHRQFQDEQRRRMYAEVQRFVTRRRWEEALTAAHTFQQRFPNCEESDALQMQLPTLEMNAEIEVRQRLEGQIMEYARQGRYIEAVDLAKKVIRDFPQSPQAQVLREQIGRLEELADNPDAPPAKLQAE